MKTIMKLEGLETIGHLSQFLDGTQAVIFETVAFKKERYSWIQHELIRFDYLKLSKANKGVIVRYLVKVSGYSRQQITRLIGQYRETGYIKHRHVCVAKFQTKYTSDDIRLIAKMDELYDTPCVHTIKKLVAEAVKNSFDEGVNALELTTGGKVPKRQLELLIANVSGNFSPFYESQEPKAVDEADKWVAERATAVLKGRACHVAAGMCKSVTQRKLSKKKRKNSDKCADYLLKYKAHLCFDNYLSKGFPVASGIIEGACRHLINDRFDITGAHWGLQTAEGVLKLRAIKSAVI